jgi:hypothetical protein
MLKKLRSLFTKPKVKEPRVKKEKEERLPDELTLSPKELATKRSEPFVSILRVDIDPDNVGSGSFELDWNDKFIVNLMKAGYKQREDDTDQIMVDRWFQTVCRNIALEVYEQEQADPWRRKITSRDLGDGRSEIS